MAVIIEWPYCTLTPLSAKPKLVPFTRSSGPSLGGVEPRTRTDLGYWEIPYKGVLLRSRAQLRSWGAIGTILSGGGSLIIVPIQPSRIAPYASGKFEPIDVVEHDDDTLFDDDTGYAQGAIAIEAQLDTPVGATVMTLRLVNADDDIAGSFFSYRHALYRIGAIMEGGGNILKVRVSPSIREVIPAGAQLEFDNPTCLCRLSDDRGMDDPDGNARSIACDVAFTEATDQWGA